MKYTIKDFQKQFPTDDVCLEYLFNKYYGEDYKCPSANCGHSNCFYRVKKRKCYTCSWCGYQVHPLAKTIFHKSDTKLTLWFYAMFMFSSSKNGVSALELERALGVTYKCAWRMAKQIRSVMVQTSSKLQGVVETDETYVGGKGKNNKRGRGAENKTPVFGLSERKGNVMAKVVVDTKRKTVMPIIRQNVAIGTKVMSDEYLPYQSLGKEGYAHQTVNHGTKEYVRGNVHTNSIEGFWSQLKRSIDGTYHAVSPKYLQNYVDEFAYRYNHRLYPVPLFHLMLENVGA